MLSDIYYGKLFTSEMLHYENKATEYLIYALDINYTTLNLLHYTFHVFFILFFTPYSSCPLVLDISEI